MKKIINSIILCCFLMVSQAQSLTGTVKEIGDDGKETAVVGAILQWQGTDVGTLSDAEGHFTLPRSPKTDILIVVYQAYDNDTITVPKSQTELNILLSSAHNLEAVNVTAHDGSYEIGRASCRERVSLCV